TTTSAECEIATTEKQLYEIDVTKVYDGTDSATFKVAAFTLPDGKASNVIDNFVILEETITEISGGETVTISLPSEGEYYIFEITDDKKPIAHNAKPAGTYTVQYPNGVEINETEIANGDETTYEYQIYYVPQSLTKTSNKGKVTVGNYTTAKSVQPVLNLTKIVTLEGFEDGNVPTGDLTMKFGLFTVEEVNDTLDYVPVKDASNKNIVIEITAAGIGASGNGNYGGTGSINLPELSATDLAPVTYYIFELDAENNRVSKGGTVTTALGTAVVNYEGEDGSVVVVDVNNLTADATVQNIISAESEITFSKYNEEGDALAGAQFELTPAETDGGSLADVSVEYTGTYTLAEDKTSLTWTTNGTDLIVSGLADGKYVLTETDAPTTEDGEKYSGLSKPINFTVSGGVITDGTTTDDYKILASSISVVNKIVDNVVISKVDMGGTEVANAHLVFSKLETTETDGTISVTLNNDEDKTVKATKIEEWDSTTVPHEITAELANGYYVLSETVAPDGY
ncbi:MAG: hypothetical protein IJY74_06305, partial [Oscillospiraceae bacterium]|nr:hypothetical protein [Oscillospiraceae bacterium]